MKIVRSYSIDESATSMIRNNLEIEKTRFGDRLQCSFNLEAGTSEMLVPPFSVQSLVENAIKYGIATQERHGRIEIATLREDDTLRIEIRDTGPGFDLSRVEPGHGLDNLISRLDTLFGPAARLEVGRCNSLCVVTLVIPA